MRISLWHIRAPILIVREPTGIVWTNQTHGAAILQSEAEGFLFPLAVTRDQQHTLDSVWWYGGNKSRGRLAYLSMIETTERVLREATKNSAVRDLEIPLDQPNPPGLDPDVYPDDVPLAWAEAWLRCRLRLHVDDRFDDAWEEREGVITWGNSD